MTQVANELPTDPNETPQDPPIDPPSADPPADPPDPPSDQADPPSPTDDPPPDPTEPKKKTAEDRIRELVAERNAERQKAAAAAEFGEYWREKALGGKKAEPEPEKQAPKLSDFGGDAEKWSAAYHEYMEGTIETRVAKGVATHLEKSTEIKQQQETQTVWQERLAKFSEQHDDALDVIGDRTFTQTPVMSQVIMASEQGPEIAYYLSQNRAENERIKQLPPAIQAAEIARLEGKVGPKPPPPPKASNAPPPPSPIKGGGSPSINLENCSMNDYFAARIPGYRKGAKK